MANFVFNISKGHLGYFHESARQQNPATASLVIVVLKASGLESDSVLMDRLTLASVLTSGTTQEVTNTGYSRKVLSGSAIPNMVVDTTNDRITLDLPDITWTGVAAGDNWGKLLICYQANSSDPDSAIAPMTAHDFNITPDGSDIIAAINDYARVS
jgi:hypothetical protein